MADTEWRGFLRLSLVSCPVRLERAARAAQRIRLEPLNGRTRNPVVRQFVDAHTGDIVPPDLVIRGWKTADGDYVTIGNDEFEAVVGAGRTGEADIIELAQFCPAGQIDRARFASAYYLYPDGALAADTLASLRLAMQHEGADAIAYLRLGGRGRTALLAVDGAGFRLTTLRPAAAAQPAEFAERADDSVPVEMVEVAEDLIRRRMLEGDPNRLPDRWQDRLRTLIAEKTGAAVPAEQPAAAVEDEQPKGREIGAEILLHVIGAGDRRFVEPGWAGEPGGRQQIEAISIRPHGEVPPTAIEYRVFAQHGRATAWVSNGSYAGTRDGELPLTGFAVRPLSEWRDRLDIVYEGSFCDGGAVGPKTNGDACLSAIDNDPLEALRITIVERPEG
jgi:DNA end-binding protein Ku